MATKKNRRHSGYVTPRATIPKKALEKYSLFIDTFYDDWQDYRDSFRDWFSDSKKIKKTHHKISNVELAEKRVRMNLKQKKLLLRRKVRKG